MSGQERKTDTALTRERIIAALGALSKELEKRDVLGEICLCGGAVMVLAFHARLATKDVDALFEPAKTIRDIAEGMAEEQNLPRHWLNDGVKGFVSAKHESTSGDLPQFRNLRLTMVVPEYLLAMKCMAARIGTVAGEPSDVPDILFLIRHLKLSTPVAVLDLVSGYYPAARIPPKTQYLVESLFEEGKI
jgi:hypothetical protein